MKYKGVIFDLDGTLLDSREDIADAVNLALSEKGLPSHPWQAYGSFLGAGARPLIVRALPEGHRDEATVAETLAGFRDIYRENCAVKSTLYPGIASLLNDLAARGVATGILTNKPHDMSLVCVHKLLAEWPFAVVIGHRSGELPKPDPGGALEAAEKMGLAPNEVLFVGDTEIDIETALRAGMTPAGVAWGFRQVGELIASGACIIIRRPQDILRYV